MTPAATRMGNSVQRLLGWRMGRWVALGVVGPLATAGVIVAVLARRIATVNGIDFRVYRTAAQLGLHLGWQHIFDFSAQRNAILPVFQAAHAGGYWTPYVTPPPAAWLQAPMAGFSFEVALLVWTGLLLAAVLAATWLLAPRDWFARGLVLAVLLAVTSADIGLAAGNLVLFFPLIVAAAWRLSKRGNDVAAGLLLGLLALKPQTAALVPLALLASGRWRVLAGFAASVTVLVGLSAFSLGVYGIHQWLDLARWVSSFDGQSGFSVARELGGVLGPLSMVATAAAVAAAAYARRRDGLGSILPVGIIGSFLVAPYLNGEDFILIAASAVILLQQSLSQRQRIFACLLVLGAAAAYPHMMGTAALVMGLMLATLAWEARVSLRSAYRPLHLELDQAV